MAKRPGSTSLSDDRPVRLGRLVAAHGIRGEVKVRSYGDRPANLTVLPQANLVDAAGGVRPVSLLRGRVQGSHAILALAGVQDRNGAEALVGCELVVARSALPPLPPGEYYWHDLLGLTVRTEGGRELGRVTAIHATGAHDVLAVGGGAREYLLPYLAAFVVRQDAHELIMRLPPGLLEMND
ncbi:MAG: 16S rRNA processing protein RimM [Desulfobulbaceae bacterium A2]|nr:MAG: 16S rRNA processing protein RimM [Desulfobulbaceae bacterium A2]